MKKTPVNPYLELKRLIRKADGDMQPGSGEPASLESLSERLDAIMAALQTLLESMAERNSGEQGNPPKDQ